MSDQTTRTLEETFRERTEALPPADFTPARIIRAARGRQRRHRAYGVLGGAAAAAVVIVFALQSGQVTSAPPAPAATTSPVEASLTVDQAARANASHAWAVSLPPGPAGHRDLGYELVRRGVPAISLEGDRAVRTGERVAVVLDRGEALLPEGVVAVSSPTKVADGWLFIGHGPDPRGGASIDYFGTTMIHVRDDLTVRVPVEGDVVASVLPSPDGRRVAVVTGTRMGGDQVEHDTVRFVTLDTTETVAVALPDPDARAIATWDGDRVAFVGAARALPSSRIHVYDLARRRWSAAAQLGLGSGGATVGLLAAPAAQGGTTVRSFVVLSGGDRSCVHLMDGSQIATEELVCGQSDGELIARVSPGGRYAVVGGGYPGRVNTGAPARVIDVARGSGVTDLPGQLLDVGAAYLSWEDDHTLVGQAVRATPVHDAATQFRWDLSTGAGQSLEFDPKQGPVPQFGPETPVLL